MADYKDLRYYNMNFNELFPKKFYKDTGKENKEDKNMSDTTKFWCQAPTDTNNNSNKILTEGIIEKWLKKNISELDKYNETEQSKVKDKDNGVIAIKDCITDIIGVICHNRDMSSTQKEAFASDVFKYIKCWVKNEDIYSADTIEILDSIEKECVVLDEKLNDIYNEVRVMCEPCETYEQEMTVLKAYNIVDEKGKIVVCKH